MGAGHDHSHGSEARVSRMILGAAILSVFFVVELVTALAINSIALLADAGHMLTDLVAMFMGLTAVLLARRFGATDGHRYVNAVLDRASRALRSAERGRVA